MTEIRKTILLTALPSSSAGGMGLLMVTVLLVSWSIPNVLEGWASSCFFSCKHYPCGRFCLRFHHNRPIWDGSTTFGRQLFQRIPRFLVDAKYRVFQNRTLECCCWATNTVRHAGSGFKQTTNAKSEDFGVCNNSPLGALMQILPLLYSVGHRFSFYVQEWAKCPESSITQKTSQQHSHSFHGRGKSRLS